MEIKSSLELHSASEGGLGTGGSDNGVGGGGGGGEESDDEDKYIDAFGTLAIRDDGGATFYGRSAGSEVGLSLILFYGDADCGCGRIVVVDRESLLFCQTSLIWI